MISKWIAHESDNGKSNALFCFPHAGGTAAYFAQWGKTLNNTDVMPVQFPMREKRIKEPMPDSMKELVKDFVDENIEILKERPFAFLGHCSGSIAAYEAAVYAKQEYGIEPKILFVSSCLAPADYTAPELSRLDDQALLQTIKDFGYIDPALIENEFMFQYFAPIVRKDFFLQETYRNTEITKLKCPIVAMAGEDDETLQDKEKLGAWGNYTVREIKVKMFPGSHFYLEKELNKVAETIDWYIKENIGA